MPTLKLDTDNESKSVDVPMGKRLVNAIEDEGHIDQLHACGGFAKCTTCRVQFIHGKPTQLTEAEKQVLLAKGMDPAADVRLSCQMLMEHDMEIKIVSRFAGSGRKDAGKRCEDDITPPPVWTKP